MAQFARPASDVSDGGWTPVGSGSVPDLYGNINETAENDSPAIRSSLAPSNDECEIALSSISAPGAGTRTLRYRYSKVSGGGRTIDVRVQFVEGTTVHHEWTHSNIGGSYTTASQEVTATISNYADLRLRFLANQTGSGADRRGFFSWAELETPDAGGGAAVKDLIGCGMIPTPR